MRSPLNVMAGLVPAIHVLLARKKDVDARHKAGHDVDKSVQNIRCPGARWLARLPQ
jgi:hypothetical protein